MGDRNHHKDRTLVLRILIPSLETAIRDKMAVAETQSTSNSQNSHGVSMDAPATKVSTSSSQNLSSKGTIVDLEGVSIEPASLHSFHTSNINKNNFNDYNNPGSSSDPTLWKFQCDGAVYPARLVNLPCPVELHKTHDHAMYYKSVDIAQMLIVYEDMQALEEAECSPGYFVDEFPYYYHSGLTPPMHKVVQRRFAAREHKATAPPSSEIAQVEKEIIGLIELLTTKESSSKKTKSSLQSPLTNKSSSQDGITVHEEVEDDVVDFEPWMGKGMEFDERDEICKMHPELWLSPQQYTQLLDEIEGKSNRGTVITADGFASATATSTTKIKTQKTHSGNVITIPNHPSNINDTGSNSVTEPLTEMKKPKKKKRKDSLLDPTIPLPMYSIPKDQIGVVDEVLRMDDEGAFDLLGDLDHFFDGDLPL